MMGFEDLPAAILVELGEKYLNSQEICAFGRTAHSILGDLVRCKIFQPIPFERVAERFISVPNQMDISPTASHIPVTSYRIGRLTSLRISRLEDLQLWCVNSSQLVDLDVSPVKDIRQLEIVINYEPRLDSPIHLPPLLESLKLSRNSTAEYREARYFGGDFELNRFILPDSLTYIECKSGQRYNDAERLTTIKWPRNLKTLLNLYDAHPIDGLVLPDGLLNLTFLPTMKQSLATITLPHSITDLEFTLCVKVTLENVKFPTALARLALQLDVDKTFKFPSFKNLPVSCHNLQLTLFLIDEDSHQAPCMNIHIPTTVHQLCIRDKDRAFESGLPKAQFVSDLSALTTLAIDRQLLPHAINAIRTHGQLKQLRIHASSLPKNQPLTMNELPRCRCLDELDLSDQFLWDDNAWSTPSGNKCQGIVPDKLRRLKLYSARGFEQVLPFPPSLTSLSFRKCLPMGSKRIHKDLKFITASSLPNLQWVDLGSCEKSMLLKWSQQFPTVPIQGYDIIGLPNDAYDWKGVQVFIYLNGRQINEYFIPGETELEILALQPNSYDTK